MVVMLSYWLIKSFNISTFCLFSVVLRKYVLDKQNLKNVSRFFIIDRNFLVDIFLTRNSSFRISDRNPFVFASTETFPLAR